MDKQNLRKVIVDKTKMPGWMTQPFEAFFHQWGNKPFQDESGFLPKTVAIIERADNGEVDTVDPECIQFID